MTASLSSNFRLPYVIHPTIVPSAAPSAAISAEAEPPPGADVRAPTLRTKSRTGEEARGASASSADHVFDHALLGKEGRDGPQAEPAAGQADLLPLVDDEQALGRDVVVGGHEQGLPGHEAHDLGARYRQLERARRFARRPRRPRAGE